MKQLLFIPVLLIALTAAHAQNYRNPDAVLSALFQALEQDNDSMRMAAFEGIFLPDAGFNALVYRGPGQKRIKAGNWKLFIELSNETYDNFVVHYDEIDRVIDYYQDLAHIHGELYQTITEKRGDQNTFELYLWYNVQLVYTQEGWKVASFTWINEWEGEAMEETLSGDTIWYQHRE